MNSMPLEQSFGRGSRIFRILLCALLGSMLFESAGAKEITYTAFTVTDGQIGTWAFHNARVYLSFESDTRYVQTIQAPNIFVPGDTEVVINETGTASVTIVTAEKSVHATFLPNQIFVSLDHGTLPGPFKGGRGAGFGMFSASAPGGTEPAYPLGIEDGTIDWGDAAFASTALTELSNDLKHDTAFSGRAWSCLGFPFTTCPAPTEALKTDRGDLYLLQPYTSVLSDGSINDTLSGGFFAANLGEDRGEANVGSTSMDAEGYGEEAGGREASAKPITYTGTLISNVRLGGRHYEHAQIFISFDADTRTVAPLGGGTSGHVNSAGHARLKILSGTKVIRADFEPNQLYVYFDQTHGSVGFGSKAGGPGYPFSLTEHQDVQGLVENSSIGAITDILNTPSNSTKYSVETAGLVTDLTNPTALSGAVSSCVLFDPTTSICGSRNPVALRTTAGDLYVYEPYTDDETYYNNGTTPPNGTQPFSINWGVFWAETPRADE